MQLHVDRRKNSLYHMQCSYMYNLWLQMPLAPVYPVVKVTELEGLFQKQHESGYWEMEALSLVHLDVEAVGRMLEEAGSKSLGGYTVHCKLLIVCAVFCMNASQ